MSEREQIARWLETLHCDKWEEGGFGCYKSNCELFRSLAEKVRNGDFAD